jgi:hypothetical protein
MLANVNKKSFGQQKHGADISCFCVNPWITESPRVTNGYFMPLRFEVISYGVIVVTAACWFSLALSCHTGYC